MLQNIFYYQLFCLLSKKHYLCRRMKKPIHIFLCLLLSALVFYGGSGVNIFLFCCDDCQSEKASFAVLFVGVNCCCTTSENATHCRCSCCEYNSCSVDRIEFNWQSNSNQFHLQPLSIDLDKSIFLSAHNVQSAIYISSLLQSFIKQSQIPPYLGKNDYFDLLCTLII